MLPKIPLRNIPMDDNEKSWLLLQMNSVVNEFHNNKDLFAKFPPGSWQISYRIKDNVLFVNITLNVALLLEGNWFMMTDQTIWVWFIIRGIGFRFRQNGQMVPEGLKVYLRVTTEDGSKMSFAITGIDLLTLASLSGNLLESSVAVMSSLNLDTEEYDKLIDE